MSMKGRLLQQGVAVGGTAAQARAYARQGLVVDAPSNGPFQKAPVCLLDPMTAVEWMDDFFEFHINSGSNEVGWVETDLQGTNTGAITTVAGNGHCLGLTTGSNPGDGISIQWHHPFVTLPATGKLWFEARIYKGVSSAAAPFLIGLCKVDTSPIASAPADGVWFEGTTNMDLSAHTADTEGAEVRPVVGSLDASTWMKLGIFSDYARSKLQFWVDDVMVLEYSTVANIPDGRSLTPTFCVVYQDGAEVVYCDYMKVVQTRY